MKPPQVIVPMAGAGDRFRVAGHTLPKPLIDVSGRPLIERLLEQFPRSWKFIFICNEEHLKSTNLAQVLNKAAPGNKIVSIKPHKLGPVHTVRQGISAIEEDRPTFINYCDFSFTWEPDQFLSFAKKTNCAGALFCYKGFHPHYLSPTMYAYCREEGGRVKEVREKGHFTSDRTNEYASSGTYFFASGEIAKKYLDIAELQGPKVNGEYYVSLVYNPMIADGLDVRVYEIEYFLQWGTPEDLADYVYWHKAFEIMSRVPSKRRKGPRLVMPMAGLGSRFPADGPPKPLIPVGGKPMFLAAKERLPCGSQTPLLILRRPIEKTVHKVAPKTELIVLEAPTRGQAETTLHAVKILAPEEPVLVSSCDHGLIWDQKSWEKTLTTKPDLIVIGQRFVPDARRNPKSYAYIDADKDNRIQRVSVKVPISDKPQNDLLLTGTFYFKSARMMGELIKELISRDERVNGELYLDSVVNLAVSKNMNVRCFESLAYLNWGSPTALAEYRYWHGYFLGDKN